MRKFLEYLCLALTLVSCNKERPQEADLTILFTTDVHGLVLPYDFMTDSNPKSSLARVHKYTQDLKAKGENTILLDAGDMAQGQPTTYYYNNIERTKPHIVGRAANYIGYDAVGIGENDIHFGENIYQHRMPKWFNCPLLCANAYDIRTDKPMFVPYTIVERAGIRVAVIAMASPDMRIWLTPMAYENIDFRDLEWTAKTWIQYVKENEHPDLIVGLFHVTPEISKDVIGKVSGFDIVLCGQDHTTNCDYIKDSEGNLVYFLQPLSHCQEIGEARVHLSLKEDGSYDKKIEIQRVDLTSREPSAAFTKEFEQEVDIINNYLNQSLGRLESEMDPIDALLGPSSVTNFINAMQLWVTGADISITNFTSTFNMIVDPIRMRDLFNIYRYDNQIWTLQMKGHEVKTMLEHAYADQYNHMTGPDDNLIAYERDENGEIIIDHFGPRLKTRRYNYICAAGINYTVDVSKPEGERVSITSLLDGSKFDLNGIYRVAMPDHIAVGGGGHTYEGVGWNDAITLSRLMEMVPNDVRVNFANFIKIRTRYVPESEFNWKVIPEEWVDVAATREKEFLVKYLR